MINIVNSLYQLAQDLGIKFYFGHRVEKIVVKNKEAIGIILEKDCNMDLVTKMDILGISSNLKLEKPLHSTNYNERSNQKQILADVIVSNMDITPTYKRLLKTEKIPKSVEIQENSTSAIIFYWGIKSVIEDLDLHNIFFANDYGQEFEAISRGEIYEDPTVYLNITAIDEKSDAPKDCHNWFVMINVKAQKKDWKSDILKAKKAIIQKLNKVLKIDIEKLIECEHLLTPELIETRTESHFGALYGPSSNSKFSAFLRHPNFSQNIKNLYFCGGSVHPGGGIPLCLLSAKIVAELIGKND